LERIAALYAIESRIRGRSAEERRAVRQAETKPLVEKLKAWLEVGVLSTFSRHRPTPGQDPLRRAPASIRKPRGAEAPDPISSGTCAALFVTR
jgi:hypothetical protein